MGGAECGEAAFERAGYAAQIKECNKFGLDGKRGHCDGQFFEIHPLEGLHQGSLAARGKMPDRLRRAERPREKFRQNPFVIWVENEKLRPDQNPGILLIECGGCIPGSTVWKQNVAGAEEQRIVNRLIRLNADESPVAEGSVIVEVADLNHAAGPIGGGTGCVPAPQGGTHANLRQ